jgi:uncharacterized membrane protein
VYALISGSIFKKGNTGSPRILRETIATALGAITGSLVNTVLVLVSLNLVLPEIITWPLILGLASVNGTVEAGFSAAIALAVILPWKGISGRNKAKLQ